MPRIVFANLAREEVHDIAAYIALDNPEAASRFLEAAHDTFRLLATMPYIGREQTFSRPSLINLRSFRVKGFESYLIFYNPLSDGIRVLHVLHGARNLESFWRDPSRSADD